MGDEKREATVATSEDRSLFERRLREELAKPEGPAGDWHVPAGFVDRHDIIVLVGNTGDERDDCVPDEVVDSVVRAAAKDGLVKSARRCGEGGVATCVARCCKAGGLGCYVMGERETLSVEGCFEQMPGRVVVSASARRVQALADMLDDVDVPYAALGQVGGSRVTLAGTDNEPLIDLELAEL